MCGIFGIVYSEEKNNLGEYLMKAARRLVYRGYDSAGFAGIGEEGKIDLRKDAGKLDEVAKKLRFQEIRGKRGIIQLRWATFGIPRKENAQPHVDCKKRLVSAHNGNVVNTGELIRELTSRGHNFMGDNDGEVVCHTVEDFFNADHNLGKSIMKAYRVLKGDYSYVIADSKGKGMFAVKKGSSLFLGIGKDFICASPDLPSIFPFTKRYIPLYDGEFAEFHSSFYKIMSLETGERIEREELIYKGDISQAEKGGFPHFMIKEIKEQPRTVSGIISYLNDSGEALEYGKQIRKSRKVFLIGSGSSYHASLMGSYFLNRIGRKFSIPVVSGEFKELFGNTLNKGDSFILVSQSGETKDTINVLNYLQERGFENLYSFVNIPGSTLYLRTKKRFPIMSELEISVAATKTFLNQAVGFVGLSALIGVRNDILEEISLLPGLLEETIGKSEAICENLAEELKNSLSIYILGYGPNHPAALEGALKIKEVSYIHGEAYYSTEFKHGPLALIEEGNPVVFLSSSRHTDKIISAINEVRVRKGKIISISPENSSIRLNSDVFIPLPSESLTITPLLSVAVLQLLAYYLAVKRDIDPDTPRNLSKTITVD